MGQEKFEGGITYESQRLNNTSNDIHQRPEESVADYDFRWLIVDSTHIQPKGADPFGEVLKASLVLRARVIPVNPMLETIKYENNYNGSRATTTNDGASANAAVFYPNIISELQDADQIFCVSIRSEPF